MCISRLGERGWDNANAKSPDFPAIVTRFQSGGHARHRGGVDAPCHTASPLPPTHTLVEWLCLCQGGVGTPHAQIGKLGGFAVLAQRSRRSGRSDHRVVLLGAGVVSPPPPSGAVLTYFDPHLRCFP